MVADVTSIRPGSEFTVGLVLSMDPGWHTYWKNSGEAGLPTRIDWTLPAGFEAGEIQWPIPNKYLEAGDVLTYGYKDETMLLVPIRVGASVKPGTTAMLRASISWLECETICVPGEAQEKLALRVEATEPTPAEDRTLCPLQSASASASHCGA